MAENPLKTELLNYGKQLREVPMPEVPGLSVYVRNATIGERLAYRQAHGESGLAGLEMFLLCCFDAMGRPFFDSAEEVSHLDPRVTDRLLDAIKEVSGMSPEKEAEAEKKSETSPS